MGEARPAHAGGREHQSGAAVSTQPLIRWNDLPAALPVAAETPEPAVTVIVPYYKQLRELRLTLCALAYQRYPATRLQVVVADDGSPDPVDPSQLPNYPFDLRVVSQVHDGFGLARARNLGARAADGSLLVFLDADMVPEPTLVTAHVQSTLIADYVVSIGDRAHVSAGMSVEALDRHLASGKAVGSLYSGHSITAPAWRQEHLVRWNRLRSDHAEGYRLASGGNLALHRQFYVDAGGSDGGFRQWGGEDLEFAYRATQSGAAFVFAEDALAWHQGEESMTTSVERRSQAEQLPLLVNRIATSHLRRGLGPRVYDVPHLVVGIRWRPQTEPQVQELLDALLEHPMGVRLHVFGVDEEHAELVLSRAYSSDPRVHVTDAQLPPDEVVADGPVPVRALVDAAGPSAEELLLAVSDLEVQHPRVAVITLSAPGSAAAAATIWSAAAVARVRRCHETELHLTAALARAAEAMGSQARKVGAARGVPRATESAPDVELLEQRLRQMYWGLSPRTKKALLRTLDLVRRGRQWVR
jgi:GT2 family glycosyltransferase